MPGASHEVDTPKDWIFGVPNPDIKTETHVTREVEGRPVDPCKGAWVTLLTKQTYLPGLIILDDSLRKVKTQYPLLVLYTSSLESAALKVLEKLDIRHQYCEYIHPPSGIHHIAARFVDTWTKLRICEVSGYDRVVMIDNDMLVLQNMDELFSMSLAGDQIAANHGCICNLDESAWAPSWFTQENCPYTGQTHPTALLEPAETGSATSQGHKQLNSGLVVLHPDPMLRGTIEAYMARPPATQTFQFPDQDVLVGIYGDNWKSLSWTYNAVKISREWHADMWDDRSIKNLHYICDKPWEKRTQQGEKDLYLHYCWWSEWDTWMQLQKDENVKSYLNTLVAQNS